MHVNQIFQPRPSRAQRRSQADRGQRTHSFSRSWRRGGALHVAVMASLLPIGLLHSAHAQNYTLNAGVNTGTYTLGSDTPGNGGNYSILYGTSGTTDILGPSAIVNGPYGYIGDGGATEIINEGMIESNVNGGLMTLRYAPFGNTGTIQALNGGTISLTSNLDNTGGTLNVDASSMFNVSGVTVTGGKSTGNGFLSLSGATLSGFTANSGLSFSGSNTITDGLTLNNTANVTSGTLTLTDSTVSTTSKGDISLGAGGNYAILASGGSVGNTIGSGITIHGPDGYIGDDSVTLTNKGLISSDVNGGQITLRYANFDNDSTIEAINGGTLNDTANIDNTGGGVFNVDAASAFNITNGVTITGGKSTGAGVLSLNNATLSGFTANTGITAVNATITNGLTLNNTLDVTSGGLTLTDSTVGTTSKGDISLGAGGNYAILNSEGSVGNTIGAGVTVDGPFGYIGDGGVTLTNKGVIASDVSGGQLNLRYAKFDNDATIEAINGGTINDTANIDNTGGGVFNVDAASAFNINSGVTITGGKSTGTGVLNLNNATLSGFTADTGITAVNATITNGLTLNNTLDVTSGGLTLTDSTVGTTSKGDISLGAGGNYAILYSNGAAGGPGNTIGAGVTVHGPFGYIGDDSVTLTNKGVIASDVSGGQITLRYANFDNDSTIEAINGGTINDNTNIDNTGGGVFDVDAASAFNITSTVIGGKSTGAGVLSLNGGTLSGFTADTGITTSSGTITNGLTLNNTLDVTGGNLVLSDSTVGTTGKGNISLGSGSNYAILDSEGSVGNTIGAGVTVDGPFGYIGDGSVTLTNKGVIASDVSGGQLTLRYAPIVNQGTIEAVNGGTLTVQTGVTDTGTVKAGAGSTATFDRDLTQSGSSSHTIADGTITINNGNGTLNVTGGDVSGSGTIQGSVANAGGTIRPGDGTGTLTVTGNYSQDSTSALNIGYTASADPTFTPTNSQLDVNGAVTLGGTLNVAFLGPAQPGVGYLAIAGENGTGPFDFLNFGSLTNTDFGTLFANEYGNALTGYFVNGIAGDDVAGVPPMYQLTEVNGDQLDLKLTTVATPEPSQWAAFGFGFLGLGGLALRARRRAAASA